MPLWEHRKGGRTEESERDAPGKGLCPALLVANQKRVRQTPQEKGSAQHCWLQRCKKSPWARKCGGLSRLEGFPGGPVGREPTCNAGDPGSIPGWGRFPAEGNGNPLQYSCLKSPMDGGAWWATVQRVATSWTRLSTHIVGSRRERQGRSFSPGASREEHRETHIRPQTRRNAGSPACCTRPWVCGGLLPQQQEAPYGLCRAACGHLENDGSLGYVQSFPMSTCFLTQSQRAIVINIMLTLSENSSIIRKLSSTQGSYPKFPLENPYFTIGNKCGQLLRLKRQTHFMRFWKTSSKYWSLNSQLVSRWFLQKVNGAPAGLTEGNKGRHGGSSSLRLFFVSGSDATCLPSSCPHSPLPPPLPHPNFPPDFLFSHFPPSELVITLLFKMRPSDRLPDLKNAFTVT